MSCFAKIGPVFLLLTVLYVGVYLVGRIGGAGVVLDDTGAFHLDSKGAVSVSMGSGILPIRDLGVTHFPVKFLNWAYIPMQELDHAVTENRFYWVFGGSPTSLLRKRPGR